MNRIPRANFKVVHAQLALAQLKTALNRKNEKKLPTTTIPASCQANRQIYPPEVRRIDLRPEPEPGSAREIKDSGSSASAISLSHGLKLRAGFLA